MAALAHRRRRRTNYYAPGRRHGYVARIIQQERQALDECRQFGPLAVGWMFWFYFPLGTWQERQARLGEYARWRASFVAWRDAFVGQFKQAFQVIADWWEANKAQLQPLLDAQRQEEPENAC